MNDYVSDREAPTHTEELLQYEQSHADKRLEHEHQVSDSSENVATLPEPKSRIIEGEMRSDKISLPEGVSKEHADEIEVQEAKEPPVYSLRSASNCETIWPTGYKVCGSILSTYKRIGGVLSWLGPPKGNERTNPDGKGKRSSFYGGSIYWHPDTGAHAITLDGMRQWGTLGFETGTLGYPTSGPIDTNFPLTQKQKFQGGDNYYNPLTGGALWGDIKQRYDRMGASQHPIGIPISNEIANGSNYRYNNFSNGTISWRNDRQTRFMYLATQRVWDSLGRETGRLGWPTKDELAYIPGIAHHVDFSDNSIILWGAGIGAREINGDVVSIWNELGGIDGLGIPLISDTSFEDSEIQRFERGAVWATEQGIAYMAGNRGSNDGMQPSGRSSLHDAHQTITREIRSARENGTADIIYSDSGNPEPSYLVRRGYYDPQDIPDVGFGADKAQYKHGFTRWDMAEAAYGQYPSKYFVPTEAGAEGWETEIYFKSCVLGKCDEYAPSVTLRQIYLAENREWFKNVPGRNGSSDTADIGLVNAFCKQNDEIVVNYCPARMRETKRFGWLF